MPQVLRVLAGGAALAALATTAVLATSVTTPPPRPAPVAAQVAPPPVWVSASASAAEGATSAPRAVLYAWPVEPATVVRSFDDPEQPWLAGHRGVDLAGAVGAPVRAAADGVVAFAGPVAGRGVVSIDHADGIRTTYEPVTATVVAGQTVTRGVVIGSLAAGHAGAGGVVPGDGGATLHWGARTGPQTYVDPTLLVAGEVVIRLWE
ncbi:murein hydrolase activator EnvC family protein [Serinibacter arcticus]|nr:M23 family metallopeptidase [Serinibacter arcticus]